MLKAADAMQESTVLCIEPPATASVESDAEHATRRAFGAVRGWRVPPNWSRCDWHNEARAIIAAAGCRAAFDYEQERGVPLRAHVYLRAVTAVWSRYRQEWSYYLHSAVESGAGAELSAMPFDRAEADETIHYFVGQALSQLPVQDQLLVRQLFWDRTREERLATMLEVSQQEVSRRKVRVLRLLRQSLSSYSALLLSQLGSLCLAIVDALDVIDLIPDLNLFA